MDSLLPPELLESLRRDGLVGDGPVRAEALTGGVSSEIFRVESAERVFVVKRALERLNVAAEWLADVSRNRFEVNYLEFVGAILPEAVPAVIHAGDGYFAMEYLGAGFRLWKAELLEGRFDPGVAARVGRIAGTIHRRTTAYAAARKAFASLDNFEELRIAPYLRAIARAHPGIAEPVEAACHELRAAAECLVHGDLSPKNILFRDRRVVLVDCEVAWYGDPAFDLAFLLTHLCLKGRHTTRGEEARALVDAFLDSYHEERGLDEGGILALNRRTARLLAMLLLARVDGKSPVEYLEPDNQESVRSFCLPRIRDGENRLDRLLADWFAGM